MKRNTQRTKAGIKPAAAGLLCALMLFALVGCGGSSAAQENAASVPAAAPAAAAEADNYLADEFSATPPGNPDMPRDGHKVILNAQISLESLDFDATRSKLLQAAADAGGYVGGSMLSGNKESGDIRTATYTLRIPAAQYSAFLAQACEAGNLLRLEESSEDVTHQYVDVEARLKALRAQEARLLAMMEEAQSIEELLIVQAQITDVQYQIENYAATLRVYDDLVAYSTVAVDIREVRTFTPPPAKGYAERARQALASGWAALADFLKDAGLWLLRISPLLVILAVAFVVALLFWRRGKRRRARALAAGPPQGTQPGVPAAYNGLPPENPSSGASSAGPKKEEQESPE